MIERQTVIDAIQDLEESIVGGDEFDSAIAEISECYSVPINTLIANIERAEPVHAFVARGVIKRSKRTEHETTFVALTAFLEKIHGAADESPNSGLSTLLFIQKTYDRALWPAANAYSRRLSKTLRITKNYVRAADASSL